MAPAKRPHEDPECRCPACQRFDADFYSSCECGHHRSMHAGGVGYCTLIMCRCVKFDNGRDR